MLIWALSCLQNSGFSLAHGYVKKPTIITGQLSSILSNQRPILCLFSPSCPQCSPLSLSKNRSGPRKAPSRTTGPTTCWDYSSCKGIGHSQSMRNAFCFNKICKNLANYITIVRSAAIQSRKSERKDKTMKTELLYATLDNCPANTVNTFREDICSSKHHTTNEVSHNLICKKSNSNQLKLFLALHALLDTKTSCFETKTPRHT